MALSGHGLTRIRRRMLKRLHRSLQEIQDNINWSVHPLIKASRFSGITDDASYPYKNQCQRLLISHCPRSLSLSLSPLIPTDISGFLR